MAVGVTLGKAHEPLKIGGGFPGVGGLQCRWLAIDKAGIDLPGHHLPLLIEHVHAADIAHAFRGKGLGLLENEDRLAGASVPGTGHTDVRHNRFIHTLEELNGGAHGNGLKSDLKAVGFPGWLPLTAGRQLPPH